MSKRTIIFKDEDTIGDETVGPVFWKDTEESAVEGWISEAEARRLAERLGAEFEQC